jgi:hypothetical protein
VGGIPSHHVSAKGAPCFWIGQPGEQTFNAQLSTLNAQFRRSLNVGR